MTSAESALLGIVIGAALAWLGNVLNSQSQWRREEHRHQRERRADLYVDMFARTDEYLQQLRLSDNAEPPDQTLEQIMEDHRWVARIKLFSSPEVWELWNEWFDIYLQRPPVRPTEHSSDEDLEYWGEYNTTQQAVSEALAARMREEVEASVSRMSVRPKRQRA
jgi:hypothetical protein